MTEQVSITEVTFPAVDSFQLSGTIFEPKQHSDQKRSLVLLPSATGTKRKFYAPFATYLVWNFSHELKTNRLKGFE
jgi:predicted alpha/beta hydrolase